MTMPIDGSMRRKNRENYTPVTLGLRSLPDPQTGCWNWQLSTNTYGYGQVRQYGKSYNASRLMYELLHPRSNLRGKTVCHHCDNRRCINPSHLYLGTPLSNMRDMYRRGRARPTGHPGEGHPSAKLTEKKVKVIRKMHRSGTIGYRNLAKMFGVDRTVIRGIIKGYYWKHVA